MDHSVIFSPIDRNASLGLLGSPDEKGKHAILMLVVKLSHQPKQTDFCSHLTAAFKDRTNHLLVHKFIPEHGDNVRPATFVFAVNWQPEQPSDSPEQYLERCMKLFLESIWQKAQDAYRVECEDETD